MYKRAFHLADTLSRKSLFLFGPRQTGKSTFLKHSYKTALYIDLLSSRDFRRFSHDPQQLREIIVAPSQKSKLIIVDEIQKLPELLDEIHALIESDKNLRFILTGSSARKLKRKGVNLLGGRASWQYVHPLCFNELADCELWMKRLNIGALPSVLKSSAPHEDLKDYVALYLKEEISAEGLSRSIENFSRFLEAAALTNAEQLNYTSLGNDAQIAPSTVRDYFEILSDTLIGHILPAFTKTKVRKAMTSGKFYYFDCGVTNALLGREKVAPRTPEYGKMLEQAVFLELKAYLDYRRLNHKLEFWRSTSQFEVDFLVYKEIKSICAIEVKASSRPTERDYKGLLALNQEYPLRRKIVVCTTDVARKNKDGVEILPVGQFLKELWEHRFIS